MRLFVAVHLPAEIKEQLSLVQDRLRRSRADVSWVKPGSLHITLKFLGEVEPGRLDRIGFALGEAARTMPPFSLSVGGMGTFGGRVPRVVWVGVRTGSEPLCDLAGRVEGALSRVGCPREKRGFTAHFTLGRVRSPQNVEALLAALHDEPKEEFGTVFVDAYSLMQSELNPGGAIHTELARYSLGVCGSGYTEETPCE